MNRKVKIAATIFAAASLWSCNQNLQFSEKSDLRQIASEPVLLPELPPDPDVQPNPPPLPSIIPTPSYAKTSGACAQDSSTNLIGCMKCQIPQNPPQEPPMSQKAKYLLEIMTYGCNIANKSDPKNYQMPNRDKILTFLNRCSPTSYVDNPASLAQQTVIDDLLSKTSDAFRQKIFGGLYYNPPYTDQFETFFGLDIGEARYMFCYDQGVVTGSLYDKGYYDSLDPMNYKLPPEYVQGNVTRNQLKSCARESLTNPWKPGPPAAGHTCKFETLNGPNGQPIRDQVSLWLTQQWTVGAEAVQQGLCLSVKSADDLKNVVGEIKVAAYLCQ